MPREYIQEENGTIWYEENDRRISFMADPVNPYYQVYLRWLNGEEEPSGTL